MKHGMKRVPTLFLKAAICGIAVVTILFCAFVLFPIGAESARQIPELAFLRYPMLLGVYATVIPFFIGLYQGIRILNCIDKGTAFSEVTVSAFRWIKNCALSVSVWYGLGMPVVIVAVQMHDLFLRPFVTIWLLGIFAPLTAAIMAAVLQKLAENALALKKENDLTV